MHSLQILSLQRFVEHVIDTHDARPIQEAKEEDPRILTSEEKQSLLLVKFQQSIQNSLSVLPNRGIKNEDNQSVFEDTASVASSKMLASQMERIFRNLKLPYIIGSSDFSQFPNVGLIQEVAINEEAQIRNQSGDAPKENEELIISNVNNNIPVQNNNIPQSSTNIIVNKGPNVPVPPPMNFSVQPNQQQKQQPAINNAPNANPNLMPEIKENERKNPNNDNSNQDNKNDNDSNSVSSEPKLSVQEMLRNQILSRSKTYNQRENDKNQGLSSSLQIKMENELPSNNNNNLLKPTKTFTQPSVIEGNKGGISLNQFIKKDLFVDEEEDNEDDLPTNILFRHSGTMRDPNRFAMKNQVIPQVNQKRKIASGNLFDMDEDDNKEKLKISQNKKKDNLFEAKMTMMKIFEDDEEEKEETTENKINSITEKTKDLSSKLNQITKSTNQHQINVNNSKEQAIKKDITVSQLDGKDPLNNENLFNKKSQPQTQTVGQSKPTQFVKKTTFFEEEDDDSKTKQNNSQKREITKSNSTIDEEKPKQVVNQPKVSFFNQEDLSSNKPINEEKKKPAILNQDYDEKEKEVKPDIKPDSNNDKIPVLSQSSSTKPIIQNTIKQEEKKEAIPFKTEESMRQSIQDRIKNIINDKEQKKNNIDQPQVFQIDYSNRRKELENMLSCRISTTTNPFLADNSHSRKGIEDENMLEAQNNNNDQLVNNENNQDEKNNEEEKELIEDNKEKEKEKIVIVQKKKPKKKNFCVSQENQSNEDNALEIEKDENTNKTDQDKYDPTVKANNIRNSKENANKQTQSTPVIGTQSQQTQQQSNVAFFSSEKPLENVKPSIPSLFSTETEPQKELKMEKKLTQLFDLDDNDNISSNKVSGKPKANLHSSLTMKPSSNDKASKLKFLFDDE